MVTIEKDEIIICIKRENPEETLKAYREAIIDLVGSLFSWTERPEIFDSEKKAVTDLLELLKELMLETKVKEK
jgi:predicted AAA+ superfamily ATPase